MAHLRKVEMKKLAVLILALFLVINFNGMVMAFHPLTTDDTGTIEPGHLETEFVGEYLKEKVMIRNVR